MGGWKLKREHFWQRKNEGSVAYRPENRKVLNVFKKTASCPTRTGMPQGVTHESCWPSHCWTECGFGWGVAGVQAYAMPASSASRRGDSKSPWSGLRVYRENHWSEPLSAEREEQGVCPVF